MLLDLEGLRVTILGTYVFSVLFAEDIVILGNDGDEWQRKIEGLSREGVRMGLKILRSKTNS